MTTPPFNLSVSNLCRNPLACKVVLCKPLNSNEIFICFQRCVIAITRSGDIGKGNSKVSLQAWLGSCLSHADGFTAARNTLRSGAGRDGRIRTTKLTIPQTIPQNEHRRALVVPREHWLPELKLIVFAPVLFRGFVWFAQRPQSIVVRRLGWTELV